MTQQIAPSPRSARFLTHAKEFRQFLRVLLRNPGSKVGAIILLGLILVAIFAPAIAPFDPLQMSVGKNLQPPSTTHWFGTDEFGRDLFSRIVFGSRLTLMTGVIAVGISMTAGVTAGLIAGYAGGWISTILMRLMDVLFSFTETLIALAAVAVLGPSLTNAMIAVGISSIPFYARVTYGAVLVEKNREYFKAAKAVGARHTRLILRHILPNILSPIIVIATVGVSVAVLSASALSFLGLGAQPPSPEWGAILAAGRDYFKRAPWITTFPGLSIAITVLAFNLLGDGLREALDPQQRRS
ncbi:nickel transporter permease [Leptolyngbya sp. FACHB-711]|uniref:nickel transporter permease n=1 Tax=Leptolyngbya sp. FACHB-711 TaxID=2692813 RepID=UPI001689A6A3|nr:nickel transporter permease [Leptolyngbya sp. FACHB-711]MBD2023261.1 ABC transporter permease [Leptolyngbya sp. FACHB-711]